MTTTTMHVTIYTAPGCLRCTQTIRRFRQLGVEPDIIDISTNPQLVTQLRQQGHRQLPVVTTGITSWSGFRLDLIRDTAATMTGEPAAS